MITKEKIKWGDWGKVALILGCTVAAAKQRYKRHDADTIRAVAKVKKDYKLNLKSALNELKKADEINPYEINRN
jgi:hypothetical protein